MQNLHCFEPDRSDPEGIGCVLVGPTVARSSSSVPSAFSLRMSDFGPERSTSCSWKQRSQAADPIDEFFFHEYGRRVGMSRLSLKERKIQSDARTWPELIRPIRKCQVASAPHQSNPTVLSKGEKSQPGVRAGCTAATTLLSRNLKGPLWRDRFLLWFLDPKLVPTKITFFPFLEGAKSWENQ